MRTTTTEILIEGLHLQCRVGVPAAERRSPQNICIDLVMTLHEPPAKDAVAATIDYGAVIAGIRRIAADGKARVLLETLARDIAKMCFEDKRVLRLEVKLRKLHKLEACDAVGVRRVFYASQEG